MSDLDDTLRACDLCGIPLTPRPRQDGGHLVVEQYCPDHGVRLVDRPFG